MVVNTPRNDDKIQKRVFRYIDAMPGAGKTEFFVSQAVKLLNEEKPRYVLIYVAPTISLLWESYNRIRKHPRFLANTSKRVALVATPTSLEEIVGSDPGCLIVPEKPRKVINYLLGLSNSCGSLSPEELPPQATLGNIILTTHESFVQVSHADRTGRDFEILRQAHVIFDEARHCVLESKSLRDVSNESLLNLRMCFEFSHEHLQGAHEGWHVYSLKSAPSKDRMKQVFQVKNWRTIPSSLRALRQAVETYSDSGRASVFMMTNVDAVKLLSTDTRNACVNLYTLLRPTGLFNHYKSVTLTSAFFKDSQMYHFLRADGHEFVDLRDLNLPELAPIYERDAKLRSALSKRLRVGVLLASTVGKYGHKAYRNSLTSNLLESGIVHDRRLAKHIPIYVDPTLQAAEVVQRLVAGRPVSTNKKFEAEFRKYAHPPLWLLIKAAAAIIEEAWATGIAPRPRSCKDYSRLALLVLNVAQKTWSHQRVPYGRVVRKLYKDGQLASRYSELDSIDCVYSAEDRYAIKSTSNEWQQLLRRELFVQSPERKFLIPPSNRLHGINLYSDVNAFVHLAALNPSPQLISFYKVLLGPDYDIDQDHSIENLVQMLYRTSLRNAEAKSKVLMIVPYRAQAELLQAKIGCGDFTYINTPPLAAFAYRKQPDKEVRVKAAMKASEAAASSRRSKVGVFREEDMKVVHASRCSISNYRRLIKKNPNDPRVPTWQARIEKFQKRLEDLRQ